jgi:hypothetical protein
MSEEKSLDSIFQKKYTEFCDDLLGTYPEKDTEIRVARALTEVERMARFRAEVLPIAGNPTRDPLVTPGPVLPGVTIEEDHWKTFSAASQKAIQEYITLLTFTCMFEGIGSGAAGANPFEDFATNPAMKAMMEQMMGSWKEKLNNIDFKAISEKMMKMFGEGKGGFKVPERMLKGQLAKLAEELVKEFKPEDFGLNAAELEETERNPSRAFDLLMNIYTQKPELLQNAMKRIAKKLQDKVRRGELRPQELAAEAEEMMKEFTDNPAFVELMEGFRGAFGFQDEESSKAAGRDGENRRAQAVKQIRAERERRQKQKAEEEAQKQQRNSVAQQPQASVEEVMRQFGLDKPDSGKKGGKGGKGGRK